MAKVTSKLQVTMPKAIADRFGIKPGDDIEFVADGDVIRVLRERERRPLSNEERLAIFDEAMKRQDARNRIWWKRQGKKGKKGKKDAPDRGWTREELYTRARPR